MDVLRFHLVAAVVLVGSAAGLLPPEAGAQEVSSDALPVRGGVVEAGLHLRQATSVRRVLVIGAHPDDEDTALLAELDRHRGVRAAYLSLTRGEGGQNLIGPELGKGLGLIRTGELLAARRLDGAEQFFTRAYDFGYSKTAAETFGHWPRDTLLSDVVWVIRVFRPHVVVSVFSGTEADGHGQHQAAGMVAREAFRVAGDPGRFPEHLEWGARPWRPLKLYRRAWRDPEGATLLIATGEYDPLLGRSPFQLAMESRSQHRSQDFGVAQPPGPRYTRLLLLQDRTRGEDTPPADPAETPGLFAGIDTSLASLAEDLPVGGRARFRDAVDRYVGWIRAARDSLNALDPAAAGEPLARALEALDQAGAVASGPVAEVLERKRHQVRTAFMAATGLVVRFRASSERWIVGDTVMVHAELWNGGARAVVAGPPALDRPGGWTARLLPRDSVGRTAAERSRFYGSDPPVQGGEGPATIPPESLARWTFRVEVPRDADPGEPYFLARDTAGDLYRWPRDGTLRARPLDPPVASVSLPVRTSAAGVTASLTADGPVRYRGVDKARGEFWRPVHVFPRAAVDVVPRVVVWPTNGADGSAGGDGPPRVTATLRRLAKGDLWARLSLIAEGPVRARAGSERLRLDGAGGSASVPFRLEETAVEEEAGATTADDSAAKSAERVTASFRTYRLQARAEAAGRTDPGPNADATTAAAEPPAWTRSLTVLDYPHIEPVPFYEDAEVRVERFPVRVDRDRRVGYVMGSGDEVPEAIRQLGLEVELLGPERVRAGDYGGLDVIVLGVRAYEVREDLRAANDRLLEWVRAGGTLLVQYNKYEFEEGDFAPFSMSMARPHDRVTDERSPVDLLHPDAPPLALPNRIRRRDFRGWIQERGLYFLHSWPGTVTPLLAMSDPSEEPKRGSLLVTSLGDGVYVYTGLAFFRQLPAGVPGAYRLFANLLSLEPAEWRSWQENGAPRDGGGRDREGR